MTNNNPNLFKRGVDTSGLRTVVYARESRDDYGQHYERIETQRDQLLGFCMANGLTNFVCDPIMDDNKSGTNFDRLDAVISMMRNKEVDVIVFKDASRLGRHQLESLQFMETARQCNVQIVFTNEGYDPDFFPLTAWFNERRAKDDSVKIRAVMLHKMLNGELVVKAPYGYKKEGKKLVVDEAQASAVRLIYQMYLEGNGTRAIASTLNKMGYLTPSQKQNRANAPIAYAWNQFHVLRILRNEQYKGTMVHLRFQKNSFLDKTAVPRPKDEWIVIDNHHDPIVSAEIWEKANTMHEVRGRYERREPHLFSGLLRCGRCGSTLIHVARKQRVKESYVCSKNQKEGGVKDHIRPHYGCETHRVNAADLKEAVVAFVRGVIGGQQDFESAVADVEKSKGGNDPGSVLLRLRNEIARMTKVIEQTYEHLLEGIIDKEMYLKKSDEYKNKKKEMERSLARLTTTSEKKQIPHYSMLESILRDPTVIDHALLVSCFEKIIYYLPGEITESAKITYGLSDEEFGSIQTSGGILFILR